MEDILREDKRRRHKRKKRHKARKRSLWLNDPSEFAVLRESISEYNAASHEPRPLFVDSFSSDEPAADKSERLVQSLKEEISRLKLHNKQWEEKVQSITAELSATTQCVHRLRATVKSKERDIAKMKREINALDRGARTIMATTKVPVINPAKRRESLGILRSAMKRDHFCADTLHKDILKQTQKSLQIQKDRAQSALHGQHALTEALSEQIRLSQDDGDGQQNKIDALHGQLDMLKKEKSKLQRTVEEVDQKQMDIDRQIKGTLHLSERNENHHEATKIILDAVNENESDRVHQAVPSTETHQHDQGAVASQQNKSNGEMQTRIESLRQSIHDVEHTLSQVKAFNNRIKQRDSFTK